MRRRDFLKQSAAGMAAFYAFPALTRAAVVPATQPDRAFDPYFLQILGGFLTNAKATSPDAIVCDFPDGTKLKGCCTPSGKTYVSVTRMLPAMVEWHASGRGDQGGGDGVEKNVGAILLSIFQHAFDPKHPDFWGYGRPDKAVQLCVESSLVGLAACRLKDTIIAQLTSGQKDNLQNWLASTAQVPERSTNHAWFTATNHASRLELSRTDPHFHGDEQWMLADIKALDGLYGDGTDGWYSDAPDQPIYDFYNFFVFPTYPLFWGNLIGHRYPEWNDKFRARLKLFLEKSPYFFDANGLHPLMGRSLIYRFAVVAPLLLGYRANLWPHSPGMLRRIVRKSLEYHWSIGSYDDQRGKLRETYSKDGTRDICENYVDNGHPYWAMTTFAALFAIPKSDPFWTAPEEPLPIEKADYSISFSGPKMLVSGCQRTGEVKWLQSQQAPKRDYFRDKYIKFVYSSHFPFNTINDKTHVPADQTLIFRKTANGVCAARAPKGVTSGKLSDNAIETRWFAMLDDWKFDVRTTIRLIDHEFELRTHEILAPPESLGQIELVEGSYPLGFSSDGRYESGKLNRDGSYLSSAARDDASYVAAWRLRGHDRDTIEETFDPAKRQVINLIHARVAVIVLAGPLVLAKTRLVSLHYASRKPLTQEMLFTKANAIITAQKF